MRHYIDTVNRLYESGPPVNGNVEGIMKVGPIVYDQREGLGAVPHNANVDYMGFATFMQPSTFLSLATLRTYEPKGMKELIQSGKPIASPFLDILFDEDGIAHIVGHEGRGRSMTIRELYGEIPMLVHCFVVGSRSRHLDLTMLKSFHDQAFPERSSVLKRGPNCSTWVWLQGWKKIE